MAFLWDSRAYQASHALSGETWEQACSLYLTKREIDKIMNKHALFLETSLKTSNKEDFDVKQMQSPLTKTQYSRKGRTPEVSRGALVT